jgi:hypothetical protein
MMMIIIIIMELGTKFLKQTKCAINAKLITRNSAVQDIPLVTCLI